MLKRRVRGSRAQGGAVAPRALSDVSLLVARAWVAFRALRAYRGPTCLPCTNRTTRFSRSDGGRGVGREVAETTEVSYDDVSFPSAIQFTRLGISS